MQQYFFIFLMLAFYSTNFCQINTDRCNFKFTYTLASPKYLKFEFEGSVATGILYIEEHGIEKGKGKYKKTETSWLGAEMTIIVVTLAHNRKQNAPPNDEMKEKFLIKGPETIYGPETVYTKSEE